jgi:dTMP kinase
MFVAVEGIEGSGKSTLVADLAERLRSSGRDVFVTREPGGTAVGDAVRAIFLDSAISIEPLTEALLMNAARVEHVSRAIRPALAAGRLVLTDRFVDSTLAYQGYGRGLDPAIVQDLCARATGGLLPDVTLLIDVPVGVSRQRTRSRGRAADRLENEDDAFHERVRAGYLELARGPNHLVLDGMLERAELVARALATIERHTGAGSPAG